MRYSYNIAGLDCADCARKLSEELNKNPKLRDVKVNFGTSRITFFSDDNISVS